MDEKKNAENIDLEDFARSGKTPPKAECYSIKVDGTKYEVEVPSMTGRGILNLSGHVPPERYNLYEKLQGGRRKRVGLDDEVDFTSPGLEFFETNENNETEG